MMDDKKINIFSIIKTQDGKKSFRELEKNQFPFFSFFHFSDMMHLVSFQEVTPMLFIALFSAFIVSLLSFSGILFLVLNPSSLRRIIPLLVAFSAGAMLGGALFHLLPEAIPHFPEGSIVPFLLVFCGFALFFILERFVFWHHCHETGDCDVHPFGYMNIVGDGIHNFIDGTILAASFMVGTEVGFAATIAIISHEIPQEIGDFGVLLHAGIKAKKALFLNFLSALASILGVLVGWFFLIRNEAVGAHLLAFAAGGFLYISASDLVPELHKEKDLKKSAVSFLLLLGGILLMIVTKVLFE